MIIAKSLAELQGGTMELNVDGDLFKVIISLPLAKEEGKLLLNGAKCRIKNKSCICAIGEIFMSSVSDFVL